MGNGSFKIEKDDWIKMDVEERARLQYNTMTDFQAELAKLNRRKNLDTVISGTGGFIGGAFALLILKLKSFISG